MKQIKWIVGLLALGVVVCFIAIGTYAWWLNSAPPGERRSLVRPTGASAGSSHPVVVELSPELAATGLTCKLAGVGEELESILFLQTEKAHVGVELTTALAPVNGNSIWYALYDKDHRRVGEGPLALQSSLGAQQSCVVTINDVRTKEAWRVLIYRQAAK
jgi:hypothetical protein